MIYKTTENYSKLFDAYTPVAYKAKYEGKYGKGLKISIPEQML